MMFGINLRLSRPLAILDLESTGVDPQRDRIVEVAVLKFFPNGSSELFHERVDPLLSIPPGATAIHGISDLDVLSAPTFAMVAAQLDAYLVGVDLAGFGLCSFDLPLLATELARTGRSFSLVGRHVIDVLTIYRRHEPRDLCSAVEHYLGTTHEEAHSAVADVYATAAVLGQQIERYHLPATPAALHAQLIEVDIAGRFRRDAAGEPIFAFGKHLGQKLQYVARNDPSYLYWMQEQAFLEDVQQLLHQVLRAATRPGTATPSQDPTR
jgi:DNA polymerase-3 subunit epsilon